MIKELFYLTKNDRRTLVFFLCLGSIALLLVWLLGGDSATDGDSAVQTAARADSLRAGRPSGRAEATIRYDDTPVGRAERFAFDPNTADSTQLLRLGLSPWQVRGIYRYRAKGGVFRHPEDFARVYGLTVRQYRELEPFIRIGADYRPASELVASNGGHGEETARTRSIARDTVKYPVKLRPSQHVCLNASDTSALKRVPGIGSYFARRIVAYRDRLGGYCNVGQLREIEGFPTEAIPYFRIDHRQVSKLNVNKLTLSQLRRHPYISYYQARDIIDYRRLRGPLTSLSQLSLMRDFTPEDIERLAPYVEF